MAKLFLGGGSAVFCLVVIIVVVFVENKKNIQQKFDVFIAEIAVCGLWAIIIAVGYKWKGVVHPDFSNLVDIIIIGICNMIAHVAKKRFCHQTEWKDCRGFAEGLLFAFSLVGVAYKMRGMWLPLGTSIVGFYINFGSAKIEENAQELRKAIPRIVRNGIIITGVLLVCKCLDKVMTENSVVIGLPWTLAFVGVMMLALGAWVKRDKLYDVCAHYPVKYWKEKDAI